MGTEQKYLGITFNWSYSFGKYKENTIFKARKEITVVKVIAKALIPKRILVCR